MMDKVKDQFFEVVKKIISAEKGTTGKVNVIGMFCTGLAGVIQGNLFTHTNAVYLFTMLTISAIIADYFSRGKMRRRTRRRRA
jgi:hypothetical protein